MLSYIPQTNFRRKDFLGSGDPDKLITSAELAAEFTAVQSAINSHTASTYIISTSFRPKDFLPTGTLLKIVSGLEIDVEFDAIEIAVAAIGGSYTKTYDFTTFHNTDAEILGEHLMIEFSNISIAIEDIRATGPGTGDSPTGGFLIITEAAEFDYITTETDDFQLETE